MYIDHHVQIAYFQDDWQDRNGKSNGRKILVPIALIKGKRYQGNGVHDK